MKKVKYIAIASVLLNLYLIVSQQYKALTDMSYQYDPEYYEYLQKYPPPRLPTVFVFERFSERIHPEVLDALITAVNKLLYDGHPDDYIENYIVIDEGENWYVYCGARGDCFLENRKIYQGDLRAVYLNKHTLRPVIPPDNYIYNFLGKDVKLALEKEGRLYSKQDITEQELEAKGQPADVNIEQAEIEGAK
ncbi:hypothetical protein P4C99_21790 [Pontiellaceae bacterium B1224]|nr:hypothetical protein [Pontiellaceae bacterium B1224]